MKKILGHLLLSPIYLGILLILPLLVVMYIVAFLISIPMSWILDFNVIEGHKQFWKDMKKYSIIPWEEINEES